ncbi:hypothetical protein SD074_05190 [Prolixibacter sp. SD074]|nr:hypothetical protein SD074_05190 [Prolixibacter sp. SD074]
MTQFYTTLARVYHEMYQHIFDYDVAFRFYDDSGYQMPAHSWYSGLGRGGTCRDSDFSH